MKRVLSIVIALMMVLSASAFALSNPNLPYTGDEMVYTGLWDEEGEYSGERDKSYPMIDFMKGEIGNITVNWEDTGNCGDVTATRLATGDIPDIFITTGMFSKHTTYDMEDLALDLRDYKEYMPNLFSLYEKYPGYSNLLGENGEVYWIPQVCANDMVSQFLAVNPTVAEELGITSWNTWDEFLAAMDTYKAAYPDKAPMVFLHPWGISYMLGALGSVTGYVDNQINFNKDTNEWEFVLTGSQADLYKETVEKMAYLYQNGYLRVDQFTANEDILNPIYSTGDSLFMYGYNMSDPYVVTNWPDANLVNVEYRAGMFTYDGGFINKNVKNPEWLCAYIDYFLSEEASYMYNFGIEGETYTIGEDGMISMLEGYEDAEARMEYGMLSSCLELQALYYQKLFSNHNSSDYAFEKNELELLTTGAVVPVDFDGVSAVLTEDGKEVKSLNLTPINTYMNENLLKFVTGERDFSEWDAFVEEALSYGDIDAVLAAYAEGRMTTYPDEFFWMPVK